MSEERVIEIFAQSSYLRLVKTRVQYIRHEFSELSILRSGWLCGKSHVNLVRLACFETLVESIFEQVTVVWMEVLEGLIQG